ncbi:MAG: DUF87 domain-containing protein, partial [Candidatus Thermoplasmatota archaeon]|nr:DUF87 domain-containing protein [Candidatus Thermoplasmatota archaeon]
YKSLHTWKSNCNYSPPVLGANELKGKCIEGPGCTSMANAAAGSQSPEEISEPLGIVFGNSGTYEFDFVTSSEVERNEYVQVFHEMHGWLLGFVREVELHTDLSDSDAKKMSEGQSVQFEKTEIAHVQLIGYPDGRGGINAPGTPVPAGSRVFRASDDTVSITLGLNIREDGAFIGSLRGRDVPVVMDIDTMVQKHISVIAKTGGGKSYLAGRYHRGTDKEGSDSRHHRPSWRVRYTGQELTGEQGLL